MAGVCMQNLGQESVTPGPLNRLGKRNSRREVVITVDGLGCGISFLRKTGEVRDMAEEQIFPRCVSVLKIRSDQGRKLLDGKYDTYMMIQVYSRQKLNGISSGSW